MSRQSLAAAVALAPLLVAAAAGAARAETQITTTTTTPVATATVKSGAPDDITVATGGTVSPTTAGAAVTLNSDNTVTNKGGITTKDVNGSIGILVQGGFKGAVTNSGQITLTDTDSAKDTNSNGLPDEEWAKGKDRFGIKVVGPGVFTGDITNATGGGIAVQGDDSAGIWIETGMTGTLTNAGTITLTGDRTKGIELTKTGSISGDVIITGAVASKGEKAQAIDLQGDVGGKLQISSAVSSTGYRATDRSGATAKALEELLASELLQGGAAVTVASDVGKGLLITGTAPAGTKADDKTTDADKDGIVDSVQTAGSIVSLGGAPALVIGSADAGTTVDIGLPTTGDFAYGLINNGVITGNSIFDPVASPKLGGPVSGTAIQIGVAGGGDVNIAGGLRNTGTITGAAVGADATAIHIGDGATVPAIVNTGSILTGVTTPNADTAFGIVIDEGASVTSIENTGTILSATRGSTGFARSIVDSSESLKTIKNTGIINASVTATDEAHPVSTGEGIAIDLSHLDDMGVVQSTVGATITQTQSAVTNAAAPLINGHVFLTDGDDTIDLQAGTLTGAMVFFGGADTLKISGGATATGGVFDSDGLLSIDVSKGTLSVTNAETINATSLKVGAQSTLLVSADPAANTHTKFVVTDAEFGSGATIGLTLQSLLTGDSKLEIVTASGTLTTGTFATGTLAGSPFLYTATASRAGNSVFLAVHPKTAAELGFSQAQTAAYDAILGPDGALIQDEDIQKAFLTQTTEQGLDAVYNQMLPDMGQGVFEALDAATQSIASFTGTTPDAGVRQAGTSLWLQEVNERVDRDEGATPGSRAKLFGVVAGYEHMGTGGGGLGVSLAYLNVQEHDTSAAVNEHTVASLLEGAIYYRRAIGGFRFSARGSGGYAWFDGDRRFVSPGVQRLAQSNWNATFFTAHAEVGYEFKVGRFYGRPEFAADYLNLREGAHTETGGGDGFDLAVQRRNSSRLSGRAILVLGAQWGREVWLRTELRGGYRHIFSGGVGDTVANFDGGSPFILTALEEGGWLTAGFSIKGGSSLSYVALEGDADFRDGEQRYNVRLAGRSVF